MFVTHAPAKSDSGAAGAGVLGLVTRGKAVNSGWAWRFR